MLSDAAQARGIAPVLADMADYKPRKLKDERDLLIITSTHGEGDPPRSAQPFFEFVDSRKGSEASGTVAVAVVDSGVQGDHVDLKNRMLDGYDTTGLFDTTKAAATDNDDCGHGTHVAGIIAGAVALVVIAVIWLLIPRTRVSDSRQER